MSNKELKRENHYVPKWYQKGFIENEGSMIQYLDLEDKEKETPKGKIIIESKPKNESIKNTFCIRDLYSTFFGTFISDEIEDKFFGEIDTKGSRAIKAFIKNEPKYIHERFQDFFEFMDIQKIRTPKGLDWIKTKYSNLSHNELLIEMQVLKKMNITMWTEGVREIVSAKNSDVKFILSDHPITTYNYAISPEELKKKYPYEPEIALKATQTIFPLNMNECLILTNFEYADKPNSIDPIELRTNPTYYRESIVNTIDMIRERELKEDEVSKINFIIKKRAKKYIAASKKEWLYPEKTVTSKWNDLRTILLPKNFVGMFGGEMFIGYEDGTTKYQDAFGRTTKIRESLQKSIDENKINVNDYCGCGSAKRYKNCCKNKEKEKRSSWKELSIRERNIIFIRGITDILDIDKGKEWIDIRKELNAQQVKEIYELYEYLWPIDTDIISLLPKNDGIHRALYSGIVSDVTIDSLILSLTFYFDDLIVQNPMTHPLRFNKDFSPLDNPEKYLDETLKNVYILIKLFPFIESGLINFIPNPSEFNRYLSLSALNLSKDRHEQRKTRIDLDNQDNISKFDMEQYQKRMYLGLSDEQAISLLKKNEPFITEKEKKEYLEVYRQISEEDPLVLLQEDKLNNSGQLHMLNFSPTYEMSLFLCQITGSILITHGSNRWEEILEGQYKSYGFPIYYYQKLTNFLDNFNFMVSQNNEFIYDNRNKKSLVKVRELFSQINNSVINDQEVKNKKFLKNFKSSFIKNYKKYNEEIIKKEALKYSCKFKFLIPYNGIVSKKVQRLIVQNTIGEYSMNVPIAIFIET